MLHPLFIFFIISMACNIHGSQYIKLAQDHIEIPNNFSLASFEAFNALASLNSFIKTQEKVNLYIKKIVELSSADLGKLHANSIGQLKYNKVLTTFSFNYDDTAYEVDALPVGNPIVNSIVKNLHTITTFRLANVKILADEGTLLIDFLKNHRHLENISFQDCEVPHESIKELCKSLEYNTKLKKLDLYSSYYKKQDTHLGFLEDADLSDTLAHGLQNNSTLTSLNLGFLTDPSGASVPTLLIEAIEKNSSLTELSFAEAHIDMQNKETYKKLMQSNSIKTLDLQGAFHRMEAMSECLPVLSRNTVLKKLNLSDHYITLDLAVSIQEHLINDNTTLQTLELRGMDVIKKRILTPIYLPISIGNTALKPFELHYQSTEDNSDIDIEKETISKLLTLKTTKVINLSFS